MIGDQVRAVRGSDRLGPYRSRGDLWIVFSVRWALGEGLNRGEAGRRFEWLLRREPMVTGPSAGGSGRIHEIFSRETGLALALDWVWGRH